MLFFLDVKKKKKVNMLLHCALEQWCPAAMSLPGELSRVPAGSPGAAGTHMPPTILGYPNPRLDPTLQETNESRSESEVGVLGVELHVQEQWVSQRRERPEV